MELTNLIWHLGALLAAIWAAFAYRSMLMRNKELEEGVLVSLLERKVESSVVPSQRQLALRRSARARALRWYSEEFLRRNHVALTWKDMPTLLALSEESWRAVISELHETLMQRGMPMGWLKHGIQGEWKVRDDGQGEWVIKENVGS